MDCSPSGSSVLGIRQAGILERAAVSSPGALPDPEIEPTPLAFPALAGRFFTASLVAETVENSPAIQET